MLTNFPFTPKPCSPPPPTPPPSGAQYPGGGDVVLFAACANILAEANKKMKEDG